MSARRRIALRGSWLGGFSLVEILVASALLATCVIFIVNTLLGTTNMARKTEDTLFEAVISQQILQSLKDHVAINPDALGHLENLGFVRGSGGGWAAWGTPVALKEPLNAPDGQTIPQLAFFQGLFNAGGGLADARSKGLLSEDLQGYTGTPELSRSELEGIVRSYAKYAVKLAIADVVRPVDIEGSRLSEGNLKELLKSVEVAVYRVADLRTQTNPQPTYTLLGRLAAPVESLSDQANRELDAGFSARGYDAALTTVKDEIAKDARFDKYGKGARDILSRIYLIFREANQEAFLTEGKALVAGPAVTREAPSTQELLATLKDTTDPAVRSLLAQTSFDEALILMGAFKRARQAMQDLETDMLPRFEQEAADMQKRFAALETEAQQVAAGLEATASAIDLAATKPAGEGRDALIKAALTQLQTFVDRYKKLGTDFTAELNRDTGVLTEARLYEYMFAGSEFGPVLERFFAYPARFRSLMRGGLDALKTNMEDSKLGARRSAKATVEWADAEKAWRLYEKEMALSTASSVSVEQMRRRFEGSFAALDAFLGQDRVQAPLGELEGRHRGFTAARSWFERLRARIDPLGGLLEKFKADGAVAKTLDQVGAMPQHLFEATMGLAQATLASDAPEIDEVVQREGVGVDKQQLKDHVKGFSKKFGPSVGKVVSLGLTNMSSILNKKKPDQKLRKQMKRQDAEGPDAVVGQVMVVRRSPTPLPVWGALDSASGKVLAEKLREKAAAAKNKMSGGGGGSSFTQPLLPPRLPEADTLEGDKDGQPAPGDLRPPGGAGPGFYNADGNNGGKGR